jgi:uncharacterized repeat protein (TIGR03803 family)
MKNISRQLLLCFILIYFKIDVISQTVYWGMTSQGGTYNAGEIFTTDINGNFLTIEHSFFKFHGGNPLYGKLCEANNGKLYGLTASLGAYNHGVLFELNPITKEYILKVSFNSIPNGANPQGSLVEASNGLLYGLTPDGGISNEGVLFAYNIDSNNITKEFDFDGNIYGKFPSGNLIEVDNGKLYGMAPIGGAHNCGTIYCFDIYEHNLIKLADFDLSSTGGYPYGSLYQASNGKIYGLAIGGGANGMGTLFEFDTANNIITKKADFNGDNGKDPFGSLMEASDGKLYGMTTFGGTSNIGVLFSYNYQTNTLTKKFNFPGSFYGHPYGDLIEVNGKLYGNNAGGIGYGSGTIFSYNLTSGAAEILWIFKNGYYSGEYGGKLPKGTLVHASNGKLYGMTEKGGNEDIGTLFEYNIELDTLLYILDFGSCPQGGYPKGSLFQATNGLIYGTTDKGLYSYGSVFSFNPVTKLFFNIFDFNWPNGKFPKGNLIEADNGMLYGITSDGGSNEEGVLFELNPINNVVDIKLSFDTITKGNFPQGGLIRGSNGKLYGLTSSGGQFGGGVLYEYDPLNDTFLKKYQFDNDDGANPYGALCNASNNKLYGLTYNGGNYNKGVLFEYNYTEDVYEKLVDFEGEMGANPNGSLVEYGNGKLYGYTMKGGIDNFGILFEYDININLFTKKFDFDEINGKLPTDGLLVSSNGNIYGLVKQGGLNGKGIIFEFIPNDNTFTKKLDFNGTNGATPYATHLIEALAVGILNNSVDKNLNVFPNPAEDQLFIELNKNVKISFIEIINLHGNNVKSQKIDNEQTSIDLSDLCGGVYILKLYTDKGFVTKKIVKI